MWQVLLGAAAAAGSGILAKKIIYPKEIETPSSDLQNNDLNISLQSQETIFHVDYAFQENSGQEKMEVMSRDGEIFRFSSPKTGSKAPGKKNLSDLKNGGEKKAKKSGLSEGGKEDTVVHQGGCGRGRKVSICLKKRRIGKHVAGKCESCASKDKSFGWGVGLGLMYMMSAGKAEMSRLNGSMDETAKVVQELKVEISRRKGLSNMQAEKEAVTNKKQNERSRCKNKTSASGPYFSEAGESASSILTEEQEPEVMEMDQLEAEFEAELQKLPWCASATEDSGSGGRADGFKAEVLAKNRQSEDHHSLDLYQYDGVSPAELDEKLCHVLIGQQESQIEELEAELHQAHSKLHEKEAELQALKDCVKRLTEFSLATASDDEIENHNNDLQTSDLVEEKLDSKSTVGMKRTMDHESYVCSSHKVQMEK